MKLGMSSAAFYGRLETEEAARHLQDFGLDTCEIFLQTFSEYSRAFGQIVRRELGTMECASIHPKGTQFETDLFGSSKRQRADAMEMFEHVCMAGEMIGASYYVLHGPSNYRRILKVSAIRGLEDILPEMQAVAKKHGMEVLWENVSWCACRTPENVHEILALFPDQRFVLDVKQAKEAGVSPMEMAEAMGPHLAHLHALDWDSEGKLTLPGQGTLDYKALLDLLRSFSYDGAVILEPYSYMTKDEGKITESLMYLRALL